VGVVVMWVGDGFSVVCLFVLGVVVLWFMLGR
jgi:hypothetical protein